MVKVRSLNLMGETPHSKMGKLPNGFAGLRMIGCQ
jgi:hypothetical protein